MAADPPTPDQSPAVSPAPVTGAALAVTAAPLVLDTMVLTWLTDPRHPRPDWEAFVVGRTLVLTFVTVGEILHGSKSWRREQQLDIESRIASYPVIPGTIGVARAFAELRSKLFTQIGDNDLWIAACVLAYPSALELGTDDAGLRRIATRFPLVAVRP